MIICDALHMLSKDTEHLPESAFYLGYADILVKQTNKEIEEETTRNSRCKLLEDIEKKLAYALHLFAKDKKNYTEIQKKGFLEKKVCVDREIKALQVKCLKLLIKELEVV